MPAEPPEPETVREPAPPAKRARKSGKAAAESAKAVPQVVWEVLADKFNGKPAGLRQLDEKDRLKEAEPGEGEN